MRRLAERRAAIEAGSRAVEGFLYQGQLRPVAELDGTGALVIRFVYGARATSPDTMAHAGTTYSAGHGPRRQHAQGRPERNSSGRCSERGQSARFHAGPMRRACFPRGSAASYWRPKKNLWASSARTTASMNAWRHLTKDRHGGRKGQHTDDECGDAGFAAYPISTQDVACRSGVTVAPTNSGLLSCLGNQRELRRNYGMWTTAGRNRSGRRAITRQPLNAGRTHCAHGHHRAGRMSSAQTLGCS